MSYAEHFSRHLRLTLLRILNEAPEGRANSSVLQSAAVELGLPASRDQVKTELAWLAEQRMISAVDVLDMMVATIAERGCDVAAGRALNPGVARPTPRG